MRRLAVVPTLAAGLLAAGCATTSTSTDPSPATVPAEKVGPIAADPAHPSFPRPDLPSAYPLPPQATPAPTPTPAAPTGRFAPPVAARPWRYIVIHHSAGPAGSAAQFDREHRRDRGWDELGYHFVIGNGRGSGDGEIEVGPRWRKQKHGAHAKTPDNRYNDYGVGVCLVGDFEKSRPTARQLAALNELTAWLMATYRIPAAATIGHCDTRHATLCPGRNLDVALVRRRASALASAAAGTPTGELLVATAR